MRWAAFVFLFFLYSHWVILQTHFLDLGQYARYSTVSIKGAMVVTLNMSAFVHLDYIRNDGIKEESSPVFPITFPASFPFTPLNPALSYCDPLSHTRSCTNIPSSIVELAISSNEAPSGLLSSRCVCP